MRVYEVADIDEFAETAHRMGWTDGLPVFPPTEKKVLAMLDHVRRDPNEVIGVVSPGGTWPDFATP